MSVFSINTDGSAFTVLHSFDGSDGATILGALIPSGSTLYGTATTGGSHNDGTIFKVNVNGTGFAVLHNFSALDSNGNNGDGSEADGNELGGGSVSALSGNTLYGTASYGGSFGNGTVFAMNTDGTAFTTLYDFSALDSSGYNHDGANPNGITLSENTLYGTTFAAGGTSGQGTVFSLPLAAVSAGGPQLTIVDSGTNVVLTWSANYTGFTLEAATNPTTRTGWTSNSTRPGIIGGQNVVSNSMVGEGTFYRLRK
jgi:uncharacterized repeat protein (TIGR03803 family)